MVYADRTRRMVTEETPALPKFDATGTIVVGDYARGSANEILAYFIRTRRSTVILLRSIPADSGERDAIHSELGAITLHEMLSEWASHDLGHLRQIAELYRARAVFTPTPDRLRNTLIRNRERTPGGRALGRCWPA